MSLPRPTKAQRESAYAFFVAVQEFMRGRKFRVISRSEIINRLDVPGPELDQHLSVAMLQEVMIDAARFGTGNCRSGLDLDMVELAIGRTRPRRPNLYRGEP